LILEGLTEKSTASGRGKKKIKKSATKGGEGGDHAVYNVRGLGNGGGAGGIKPDEKTRTSTILEKRSSMSQYELGRISHLKPVLKNRLDYREKEGARQKRGPASKKKTRLIRKDKETVEGSQHIREAALTTK